MQRLLFLFMTINTFSLLSPSLLADEIRLAVASNFTIVLKKIVEQYNLSYPHHISITSASTGTLYSQIVHGAPFDIFLAADTKSPKILEQQNLIVPGSRYTYAYGKLVLVSRQKKGEISEYDIKQFLHNAAHIAIASPSIAPYGKATREVLEGYGIWQKLHKKIVSGKNVSQAFQFVHSGNADIGFVAQSLVLNNGDSNLWHTVINPALHQPIEQQAVMLKDAEKKRAAILFFNFLKSTSSLNIIESNGYYLDTSYPNSKY